MAGQLSAYDDRGPHCASDQPRHSERGIRGLSVRSVLSPNSGIRSGGGAAYSKTEKVRPVSILARLLAPFAGASSERIAIDLLDRFGSLDRILSASVEQIVTACGDAPHVGTMIAGARALVLASMQESVVRSKVDPADPNLKRYLALKFRGLPYEELHAIFVDDSHGFMSEELVALGSSHKVEVRIAPLLRRALELGARGFYLVHNHPSGSPQPSPEDISATLRIVAVARAIDVAVLDHLIIAGKSVVSMRKLGLL